MRNVNKKVNDLLDQEIRWKIWSEIWREIWRGIRWEDEGIRWEAEVEVKHAIYEETMKSDLDTLLSYRR